MSEAAVTPEPTPAPEPAPEPTPAPSSWRDSLGDDLRENPSLTKFEDVGSLAKSYVEVQGLVGKKGIIPPGENATPEQIEEFHRALGRPETIDGYETSTFQPPEVLADAWDMNGVDRVAKVAFEKGVSKDAFSAMLNELATVQAEQIGERVQHIEQGRENATKTLQKEWGTAFEAKSDQAKRAFRAAAAHVGIDPQQLAGSLLPDGGIVGDNPDLMRIFAALGEAGGELPFLGGKGSRFTLTPEEAETELGEIEANPALVQRSHPEHKALVDRRAALLAMIHPDESGETS